MGRNIDSKLRYFGSDEMENYDLLKGLQSLPDYCPLCKKSITPEYILIHNKNYDIKELLCACPSNSCGSLFFAVYKEKDDPFEKNYDYSLDHFTPFTRKDKDFPTEVSELSPDFVAIFNQSHHAEQGGLDLICGVGYRKALEYLIKDYVFKMYPTDDVRDQIQSMPLQQCVKKYIIQPEIKDMAERAIWLGNDETHYARKWESKDLNDLKNLIDLTVYFISMTFKAMRYNHEMVMGKK